MIKFTNTTIPVEGIEITVCENNIQCGRAIMYIFSNPNRGKKYGLLSEVMIEPDHRGNGIGTKLIQKALDTAKEEGCYKVLASSRFSRERVHKLYEGFGFEKHGYDFRLDIEEVPDQL